MWLIASGLAGALITGLVTIVVARHSKSGRVETSEAKDLWDTLRGELARLQAETTALRAEITVARQEMAALREDATAVGSRASDISLSLKACHMEATRLRAVLLSVGVDPGTDPDDPPKMTTAE